MAIKSDYFNDLIYIAMQKKELQQAKCAVEDINFLVNKCSCWYKSD